MKSEKNSYFRYTLPRFRWLVFLCYWFPTKTLVVNALDIAALDAVMAKLKADAREFAEEVGLVHFTKRCDEDSLFSCENANYGECQNAPYPEQQCLGGPSYQMNPCGSDHSDTCVGLWDNSISTVSFPQNNTSLFRSNSPLDPLLIETICFTRHLDDWFLRKRNSDLSYWRNLGVQPRSMYFGSHTGAFRMYPARQSTECGVFDPRIRPWYVAGSSGPKNVVLILDISGSMNENNRIGLLKQAASRIVSTLTVSDRVLVVPFASTADPIADENGFIFRVTNDNKAIITDKINQLKANGGTNFFDAFSQAFDVLRVSAENEMTTSCENTAILFLTDGVNTEGQNVTEVTDLVDTEISAFEELFGMKTHLFTYSIGDSSDIHVYPKQLACSVENGLWSKIDDANGLVDSLSSYYRLFALGLGSDENQDFAAVVEPYQFFTGGIWGTTISVPVYDRTKTPLLFLGVVGVDVALDALDSALTSSSSTTGQSWNSTQVRAESIRRVVLSSEASCPNLELSPCEMEAYRSMTARGGKEEAMCGENCTGLEVTQVQEEACPNIFEYPKHLFVHNSDNDDDELLSYPERACCTLDTSRNNNSQRIFQPFFDEKVCLPSQSETPTEDISSGTNNTIVIAVVIVVAAVVIVAALLLYCICRRRQKNEPAASPSSAPPPHPVSLYDSNGKAIQLAPPPTMPDVEDLETPPPPMAEAAATVIAVPCPPVNPDWNPNHPMTAAAPILVEPDDNRKHA